jgi:hypothetical protein
MVEVDRVEIDHSRKALRRSAHYGQTVGPIMDVSEPFENAT